MESMNEEQEWLSSLIGESTRKHHQRAIQLFKQFVSKEVKDLLEMRRQEGRRFSTRLVLFWKWLQSEQKMNANTSSSYVFGVSSLFRYYELPLTLKGIPDIGMRLERYCPSLEDLQKLYHLNGIETKYLLSLMRDCPARVSDLVQIIPEMPSKEIEIRSKKENVEGKAFITDQSLELCQQMEQAGKTLPLTERGLGKLLEISCKNAGISKINPHLLRKYWFTIAANQGIGDLHLKILMFKNTDRRMRTYLLLNPTELRSSWEKVVNAIPLEQRNHRVSNLEQQVQELKTALGILEAENGSLRTRVDNMQEILAKVGKRLDSYRFMLDKALTEKEETR